MSLKNMRYKVFLIVLIVVGVILFSSKWMIAQQTQEIKTEGNEEVRILPLREFIDLSVQNDTEFEEILIDELTLQYQKALKIPAKDLVLSVKHQHEFFLDQDRDSPDTTVSLSKLFPDTGTEIDVGYEAGASVTSSSTSSEISFAINQTIAENAFGRSTRMLDKIVGLEVDVARHQVIEAYEDYMAVILISPKGRIPRACPWMNVEEPI